MSGTTHTHSFHKLILSWVIISLFTPEQTALAQHNGDPLLFQGLSDRNSVGVKASAYGNAFVSRSNDLNSIFYNAAGLANISSIQVSVSSQYRSYMVRDNQYVTPTPTISSGGYTGINLYLGHVLIPDPAWNNIWSDSLRTIWYDSLGNPIGKNWWDPSKLVTLPQDQSDYSEDAAANQKKKSSYAFDHIAIAIPFEYWGKHFVAAASYSRQYDDYDYDWNGAYLAPHWGMVAGDVGAVQDTVKNDIVRSNWSVFTRERSGGVYSFTGALAFKLDDRFQIGVKFNYLLGQTDDLQELNRIGYFQFKNGFGNSSWSFSYDTNDSLVTGTSKFYGTTFNIGATYVSKNFSFGLNVQLPYRLERDWSYSTRVSTLDSSGKPSVVSSASTGRDYVSLPAIYTAGITFSMQTGFTLSFDYGYNPLRSATYSLNSIPDSLFTKYQKWVDQTTLRLGLEYAIDENVSLLAGYQTQGAPFVGYAVADKDQGGPIDTYSCGLSVNAFHGRFDVSYTYSQLKYYDVYMTNRNFTLERSQAVSIGYTYMF
jgi:hypothetical protein